MVAVGADVANVDSRIALHDAAAPGCSLHCLQALLCGWGEFGDVTMLGAQVPFVGGSDRAGFEAARAGPKGFHEPDYGLPLVPGVALCQNSVCMRRLFDGALDLKRLVEQPEH